MGTKELGVKFDGTIEWHLLGVSDADYVTLWRS